MCRLSLCFVNNLIYYNFFLIIICDYIMSVLLYPLPRISFTYDGTEQNIAWMDSQNFNKNMKIIIILKSLKIMFYL